MLSSFLKPVSENALDTVNFHGYIRRGNPGDLADRCGIHAFEVREDHRPVNRLQALDQMQEAFQGHAPVHGKLALLLDGYTLDFFQADESGIRPPLTDDVR